LPGAAGLHWVCSMASEVLHPRRPFAALALAVAGLAMAGGLLVALAVPAEAQFFDRRQRQGPEFFNPFRLFGPVFPREPRGARPAPREPATVDHSRAPPPRKRDTTPTQHIVVMGASLSDWLAYGLEDIYSDQPEIGIVRKNHLLTGLVRFDSKDQTTWPQVAREFLAGQNPDVIVVLLGLEDRQAIRERPAARDVQQRDSGQPAVAAPEQRRQTAQSFDFRTDKWAEAYAKRLDDMIAALKSKGAPVIWVGLPAIRGTRSTSDMIYLNDLIRARAERAGIVYVDVWDGFVDEAGRYATFGPDVEGQVRRLRTAEGVYFTKFGARKLAHYVEREIKRVIGTRLQPMATPSDESGQPAVPGTAAQPVAGPVVSLTGTARANELLGAGPQPGVTDPLAARVLVKGTAVVPPSGRADNFFLTPEAAEAAKAASESEATPVSAAIPAAAPARGAAMPLPPAPIVADEPKSGGQDKPDRSAAAPAADVDPAPAAAPRRAAPSKPAARPADRAQQPGRAPAQKLRPTPPRDNRAAAPRPQRQPIFDPLGIFR